MENKLQVPQVKYLYGSFVGKNSPFERLSAHVHADYWQIEIAVAGHFVLHLDDRECEIPEGTAVFVPPGVRHTFAYASSGVAFATAKFKIGSPLTELPIGHIVPCAAETYFLTEIVRLLRELPPEFEKIIGFLLGDLFALHYGCRKDPGVPRIISIINSLISRSGGRIRVPVEYDTNDGRIFAFLKERIAAVKVDAPRSVHPGRPVRVEFTAFGRDGKPVDALLPAEIRMYDASGRELDGAGWVCLQGGSCTVDILTNIDDASGDYRIVCRDRASGLSAVRTVKRR